MGYRQHGRALEVGSDQFLDLLLGHHVDIGSSLVQNDKL